MTIGSLLALEPGAAEGFERHWLGYNRNDRRYGPEIAGLLDKAKKAWWGG